MKRIVTTKEDDRPEMEEDERIKMEELSQLSNGVRISQCIKLL